jgi:hypothetical protein
MRTAFRIRRLSAAAMLTAGLVAAGVASTAPSPAAADPKIPFEATGSATIHLAKLGQDFTGQGKFSGTVDLATGDVTGSADLGTTETSLSLGGLTLATVAVQMQPTAPLKAHVDFSNLHITAHLAFNIKVVYVRPLGIAQLNLVGNRCTTKEPLAIDIDGTIDLATFSLSSGPVTFTIPQFKDCKLTTPLLNALISGPGNTIKLNPPPA